MGKLAQAKNYISGLFSRAVSPITDIVGKGLASATSMIALARIFTVSHERNKVHKEMDRMDKECEITKFAHDAIASRTVGMEDKSVDSLVVMVQAEEQPDDTQVSDSVIKRAQHEINQLIKRTNLKFESWQIVRRNIKYGNEFREVLIDAKTNDIVGLKLLPEHTMWPRMDERGNRIPGFEQRLDGITGGLKPIEFADYEIIHWSFGELDGYIGTPLMACARKTWNKLQMMENATAIARMRRAFMRFVHHVPISTDWPLADRQKAIDVYKEKMSMLSIFNTSSGGMEMQEDPSSVSTDFYIPDDGTKRGGVDMLDPGNAQLQNLSDLEYFRDRFLTATTVPKRYFPFEGSTPKLSEGGGNAEDVHYAATLRLCQMILKQGLASIFDRQLLLKGIDPGLVRYVIQLGDINAENQLTRAQTQMTAARAMDLILSKYPEFRENVAVMLRNYTSMDDASISQLLKVEIKDLPEPNKSGADDKRVDIPGKGNPNAKGKV
jgi:hypothetical protein